MSTLSTRADVLIFGIHRTVEWWRFIGQHIGWGNACVATDLRGEGDVSVVDRFYAALTRVQANGADDFGRLSQQEQSDVIARCRVLRWLDPSLARSMVQAMAEVMEELLDQVSPRIVLSFPIDRYVTDILARMTVRRGLRYVELTASVIPGMSMLLERGRVVPLGVPVADSDVNEAVELLSKPSFTPSYVAHKVIYTRTRFIRTLAYFNLRGLVFRILGRLRRDPLNLHYLDAQPYLGHKCRWKDIRITSLCDGNWRKHLDRIPADRRVLFGLQLFPEASIDYWIHQRELIDNEDLVVEAASAFSKAGYLVLVKDHPLQFGFRHTDVIDRLLELPNVVLVPYEVSGNELMSLVDVNFTCTGTLGMQAALLGKKSVVTESYYTTAEDFVLFNSRKEIPGLPARVQATSRLSPEEQRLRQERILRKLLGGSFEGDFFSFRGFSKAVDSTGARKLAATLGSHLARLSGAAR